MRRLFKSHFCDKINVGENELSIRTMLKSNTGQYIMYDSVSFKFKLDIQQLGSYITYQKRYMLSAILQVSLSPDTDCSELNAPEAQQSAPQTEAHTTPTRRRRV